MNLLVLCLLHVDYLELPSRMNGNDHEYILLIWLVCRLSKQKQQKKTHLIRFLVFYLSTGTGPGQDIYMNRPVFHITNFLMNVTITFILEIRAGVV